MNRHTGPARISENYLYALPLHGGDKDFGAIHRFAQRGGFTRSGRLFCSRGFHKRVGHYKGWCAADQSLTAHSKKSTAPIHESRLRLGYLLKARRSAGRWWSSDKADWKSVVVTWSGRRLYPLHWMKRLLLKRSIIPRTNIALSLRTLHRSSLWEISKR